MGLLDHFGRKDRERRRARRLATKQWWETAAEFPADELFYDPELTEYPSSEFDPQGSYTGRPIDGGDVPLQDVDDL